MPVECAHGAPVNSVHPGSVRGQRDTNLFTAGAAGKLLPCGIGDDGPGELRVEGLAELEDDHAGSAAQSLAGHGLRGRED